MRMDRQQLTNGPAGIALGILSAVKEVKAAPRSANIPANDRSKSPASAEVLRVHPNQQPDIERNKRFALGFLRLGRDPVAQAGSDEI